MKNQNDEKQSEGRHSQEPWSVSDWRMDGVFIHDSAGRFIARLEDKPYRNQARYDAVRIVACVNFCAGSDLKTELEFGPNTYKEAVESLRAELAKNKAAREWIEKYGNEMLKPERVWSTSARLDAIVELRALIQPEEKK